MLAHLKIDFARRKLQTKFRLVWKFWWPLSRPWKFQTKFSLVRKRHWMILTPWFGLEKSLCFASPISWSILHPQVWLSSLLYKQASPLMGKRHLRRVQNISVFLLEEVPRVAASHGYDHNSIWPAGIVPLIPILIIKDPDNHGTSSSNWCLLVHLNNL